MLSSIVLYSVVSFYVNNAQITRQTRFLHYIKFLYYTHTMEFQFTSQLLFEVYGFVFEFNPLGLIQP